MTRIVRAWIVFVAGLGFAAIGNAQPAAAPRASAPPAGAPQLDAVDLDAWLDGMMRAQLKRTNIAGGAVIVVKDGAVLFQKGYGYADIARRVPVDPERTLFRPGSVNKVFTWTAIMQLVEQGKLDLDADVNRYLDFKLPQTETPITLRHLMTHSAGFEEHVKGLMASRIEDIMPLGDYVRKSIPAVIYPPGRIPAYSNYSTALAGYIIERVSGRPYDIYMREHVLKPIGMTRSTFRIPPEPALMAALSKGYLLASGEPGPFELDQARPAGSISATVADMGRFMIAHLHDGRGLLQPRTAQRMHRSIQRPIPGMVGNSLGFFQYDRNNRYIIGHGGTSQYFYNELRLFPDERVGLFIALNSAGENGGAAALMEGLIDHFIDRYYPAKPREMKTAPTAREHAAKLAGRYETSRRVDSGFMKFIYVVAQQTEVIANDDDTISVTNMSDASGRLKRWREIAPFQWQEVGGQDVLAARVEGGRVTAFGTNGGGASGLWLSVPWFRSGGWILPALVAAFAISLLTVIAWPIAAIVRRRFGGEGRLAGRTLIAYRLSRVGALLNLAFILGWAWVFLVAFNDLSMLSGVLDPWMRVLQGIGLLGGLGTVAALWLVWLVWTGHRDLPARLWNPILALAGLMILWTAFALNFITYELSY